MTTQTLFAKKHRLKIMQRAPVDELPGFRLTQRDREIVRAIYQHRALTTAQIEALFFPPSNGQGRAPSATRCQHRLKLLYHHGFLMRDEQPLKVLSAARKPLVYLLDQKGAALVAQMLGLDVEEIDWRPKDNQVSTLFLDHLLATNNVRVAITIAARQKGYAIEIWLDDKTLKREMKDYVMLTGPQGGQEKAAVVPDGYFALHAGEYRYHHFLEIDLRTVVGEASKWGRRDWARKIKVYLAYHNGGQYQERYGTRSLRILTVTTGEKRLSNLKRITEKSGGRSRFWFTTFDLATSSKILTEPIWQVAGREGLHVLTW
jgi:hypothetical protein